MIIDGKSWRKFYNDLSFWGGAWHDEEIFLFNGKKIPIFENPTDSDIIEIIGGKVYDIENEDFEEPPSLETFFLSWQKKNRKKEKIIVICECNFIDLERLKEGIKLNGGEILNKGYI
jgi:hypothetical protein